MSGALLVAERICENCGARMGSVTQRCPDCDAPTPARSAALDGTDPAPVRRRAAALLIDALPPAAVLAAVVFALVTSADGWWWPTLLGLALAWLVLLLGWGAANGQGPGAALVGVRVVDGRTGKSIGVGRTIVRQLARIGAVVGTLGVAGLSYRWDPAGRERTWWDRAVGSRVIASGDGEDPGARFVDPAVENRWTPQPPIDRVPGLRGREDQQPSQPTTSSPRPGSAPVPVVPPGRSAPTSAPRSTPDPAPLMLPPAVRASMVQRPPTAGDPDPTRVVRRTEIIGGPPGPDSTDIILRKDIASSGATGSTATGATGSTATSAAGSTASRATGSTATGATGSTATGATGSTATNAAGDAAGGVADRAAGPDATGVVSRADITHITDITRGAAASEATRVVPRSQISAGRPATATLAWDSGSRVVAGGVVIIGRDPVPGDGEHVDRRLAVGAESVGVSKTHLTLTITAGGVTVTDRYSTNGVRIERAAGETVICDPGRPTPAGQGDRILFGGRSIVIAPG